MPKGSKRESGLSYHTGSSNRSVEKEVFSTKYLPNGNQVKVLNRKVFEGALKAASNAKRK